MQFHKQRSAELLASTWLQSSSSSFNPFYSSSPKVAHPSHSFRNRSHIFSLFNYFENEPHILDLKIIQIVKLTSRLAQLLRASLLVREVQDSIPGPVNSNAVSPPLRSFLSCVAQAPGRGDGPHHSLHASAQ